VVAFQQWEATLEFPEGPPFRKIPREESIGLRASTITDGFLVSTLGMTVWVATVARGLLSGRFEMT